MKNVLIIQTGMMLKQSVLNNYHKIFVEQIKSGVVVIPAFFKAKLLNVPDDIEVIVEGSADKCESTI